MKKEILVADVNIPYLQDYFANSYEIRFRPGRTISHNDLKDASALLVRSITKVDKALLRDTPVKFVGSMTAGMDHVDTHWLDEVGIDWAQTHGFNAPPVADYVVSTIAALNKHGMLLGKQRRAAVIGVGSVGKLVADRLALLGFDVVLCDPIRAEQEPDFKSVPIDEIQDVDLITLHVPLSKTGPYPTYQFINKPFIERQKLGCVLLNASRGAVIHSSNLMEYGSHLHWCFDVWEHEPHIDKSVLEEALITTPHIAGYSVQSKIRGVDMIYKTMLTKNLIPVAGSPIVMPRQQLVLAGHNHKWQDIVLSIFNPAILTNMMKTILLSEAAEEKAFDQMRNQFTYRHEFAYSDIDVEIAMDSDKQLIEQLHINLMKK